MVKLNGNVESDLPPDANGYCSKILYDCLLSDLIAASMNAALGLDTFDLI